MHLIYYDVTLKLPCNQFLELLNRPYSPLKWVKIDYEKFETVRGSSQNGLKSIFRRA